MIATFPAGSADPADLRAAYDEHGFAVLRDLVPLEAIDRLMAGVLDVAERVIGRRFPHARSGEIVDEFLRDPAALTALYDAMPPSGLVDALGDEPAIASAVLAVLGTPADRIRKIPLRMDMPGDTREFAHWHQDYWYVRGDIRTVTCWIPLQDTTYVEGCIGVMPGSHRLGPLPHDLVIGKRHVAADALEREIRLVPANRGDVVLFHSCMVHGSTLNASDSIRFSVQARFVPAGAEVDPAMGGRVLGL